MSVYSLTTASEKAIGMLLTAGGGSETLLLRRPANELRAELHLEAAGRTLTAVIMLGHQRNTLTLQDGDGANQLNLADYIESIANGTADTAETGTLAAPVALLPCCKCGSEAIAFDYADPRQTGGGPTQFINGVKCRHNECCVTREHATEQQAAATWNAIQSEPLAEDHAEANLDMVNHPPHYTGHPSGVECIEVAEHLPFCLGNAFKYLFRRDQKDQTLENINKAIWYLERHVMSWPEIEWSLPSDVRDLLGSIAAREPHPFGGVMLIIGATAQCGGYDAAITMLREEAERLGRGAEPRRAA